MGPQDPKDVARDTARDLSGLAGELVALKADARHWLFAGTEFSEVQLRDGERRSVRRVMSSSCSQPSPTKE